jgi:hypothetical protein
MVLSDENIREFQAIYKEHFGTEISKEEAYKNGLKLLQLIRILYTPTGENQPKTEKILPKINQKYHGKRNI